MPDPEPAPTRPGPTEGWILAGRLDGAPAAPALLDDVAGLPHALRLACDLAQAGIERITVVWTGEEPPDLSAVAADPRLAGRVGLRVALDPPEGDEADPVLVVRADRVFHRDTAKCAVRAWRGSAARLAKVGGDEHDAVVVAERPLARRLAAAAAEPSGFARLLAGLASPSEVAAAEPPYFGFTTPAADRSALRRAEWRLLWSLRKPADGIAAKILNRRVSLPITRLLMRTWVHPNLVTAGAFLCAVAGGILITLGGWANGVWGMLLVEAGSIADGIDGELSRLRYQGTRLGQWMDTVVDDASNVAYVSGITYALWAAGATWAAWLGVVSLAAFVINQATQYILIATVYKSGDLAAIPWMFQSSQFLSSRPTGFLPRVKATVPKMLKRDFAVTAFVGFALLGRLDFILLVFAAGALSFHVTLWIQLSRNREAIRAARRGLPHTAP
ncbi:MAG: CDP-alcohol phosphatidyltransferase family protein [Deltaproteobacteria bacterium]|nr:CDP-alcohol phosphatidyltransferase family protein [Deltaproteobacteria bacterium]